jgi:phage terminase large subunit GpA-like protein
MRSPGMRKVLLNMAAILAPGSGMGVSVWADCHRYLSAESGAKVGQWKSYPYQVEPMDAASDPAVHRVVLMSATQMIKTSVIENAVGRTIDVDPLPILIVQPRKEDAVDFVEERIEPMIRDTPRLREKVYKASKKLKKLFRGGMLTITSAGKADNAARRAIGLLCLDEVDKYRLTREGNFIPLARKRLETYKSRGKEIIASSPTFEGVGDRQGVSGVRPARVARAVPAVRKRAEPDEEVPDAGSLGLDAADRRRTGSLGAILLRALR